MPCGMMLGALPKVNCIMCYKAARKSYRKALRNSVNKISLDIYSNLNKFHMEKRPGKFWNLNRRTKPLNKGQNIAITIDNLTTYFTDKFGESRVQNEFIQSADARVQETYDMENVVDTVIGL